MTMPTFHWQIGEAQDKVEELKRNYLQRFGWEMTCNTPGSYWLWRRDFSKEDAERHARWVERGAGPYGMPSEPRPYGVITANTDLAVSITESSLDDQAELVSQDESEDA